MPRSGCSTGNTQAPSGVARVGASHDSASRFDRSACAGVKCMRPQRGAGRVRLLDLAAADPEESHWPTRCTDSVCTLRVHSNPAGSDAGAQEVEPKGPGLTRTSRPRNVGQLPQAGAKSLGAVCARNLRTQQRAKSQCQIMHKKTPCSGMERLWPVIRVRIPLID